MVDFFSQDLPAPVGDRQSETEPDETFYVAVLLYESASNAANYLPLYEESFVLIKARSIEEAETKARARAASEQVSYINKDSETISWALKHIIDVSPVLDESFNDGSDLYARHFRNYAAYVQFEPLLSGEPLDD